MNTNNLLTLAFKITDSLGLYTWRFAIEKPEIDYIRRQNV